MENKHTIFGEVVEGFDILDKINQLAVNEDLRPYCNIRIIHTYVVFNPFRDEDVEAEETKSPAIEKVI